MLLGNPSPPKVAIIESKLYMAGTSLAFLRPAISKEAVESWLLQSADVVLKLGLIFIVSQFCNKKTLFVFLDAFENFVDLLVSLARSSKAFICHLAFNSLIIRYLEQAGHTNISSN